MPRTIPHQNPLSFFLVMLLSLSFGFLMPHHHPHNFPFSCQCHCHRSILAVVQLPHPLCRSPLITKTIECLIGGREGAREDGAFLFGSLITHPSSSLFSPSLPYSLPGFDDFDPLNAITQNLPLSLTHTLSVRQTSHLADRGGGVTASRSQGKNPWGVFLSHLLTGFLGHHPHHHHHQAS